MIGVVVGLRKKQQQQGASMQRTARAASADLKMGGAASTSPMISTQKITQLIHKCCQQVGDGNQ